MIKLNPYLNFMGKTEEAFNFYASVFGTKISFLQRFKETPEKDKLPANELEMVMHVALPIGQSTLMATDALESMGHKLTYGNALSLSIETDDRGEAESIFNGLSAGGKVDMPLQDMFWGAYFGMVTDKYGVKWMINCANKK